jgi:3-dehydroquinate synthase
MAESRYTVHVNVAPAAYDVVIEPGLLRHLGGMFTKLTGSKKVGLVTDTNVARHHLAPALNSLNSEGIEVIPCVLPAGEEHKTLENVGKIYDKVLPAGIDRRTPLMALGGGVVGDMTGFAAATILRGVPFVQVPTTLLSSVDASVGGKTGIDHPVGKNLIGAFHQPMAVLIDPAVLLTLPERELISGLAECVKHDIIRDADHFAQLDTILTQALTRDLETLSALIAHNVTIKAKVVEADPFEKGERAHLNFGHTFGHAFEKVSEFGYSHGEGVGLGMVAASRLAEAMGLIDADSVQKIIGAIGAARLPVSGLKLDVQKCVAAMLYDKKVSGVKIRFVLPDRIGHVVIRDDVPPEAVAQAVASLRE